jgi:hypothetical protein
MPPLLGFSAFRAFEESQGFAFQMRYLREILMTARGEALFHLGQVHEILGFDQIQAFPDWIERFLSVGEKERGNYAVTGGHKGRLGGAFPTARLHLVEVREVLD